MSVFNGSNFRYTITGIPNLETAAGPDLGGNDLLAYYDTPGDDTFNADGDTVEICKPGYSHKLKYYDTVLAYSREGGQDTGSQSAPTGRLRLLGGGWN